MKKKEMMLQLFADDPESKETGKDEPEEKEPKEKDLESKEHDKPKYTDEDVDKLLSRKFAEWEKKQEKKAEEANQAKKLEEMNAQQRAEHRQQELENRLAEFERKDALAKMSKTARSMLSEKDINVSDELLSMLVTESADDTKKAVDAFISLFQGAVKKAVTEALKGEAPKRGTRSGGITKADIMKVKNRAERQRLIRENEHLFK